MSEYYVGPIPQQLGARDGWDCHYCGCALVYLRSHLVDWFASAEDNARNGHPAVDTHEWMPEHGRVFATTDHKVPRSRGGGDELSNLVLCCASCNSRKATKKYEEFVAA